MWGGWRRSLGIWGGSLGGLPFGEAAGEAVGNSVMVKDGAEVLPVAAKITSGSGQAGNSRLLLLPLFVACDCHDALTESQNA